MALDQPLKVPVKPAKGLFQARYTCLVVPVAFNQLVYVFLGRKSTQLLKVALLAHKGQVPDVVFCNIVKWYDVLHVRVPTPGKLPFAVKTLLEERVQYLAVLCQRASFHVFALGFSYYFWKSYVELFKKFGPFQNHRLEKNCVVSLEKLDRCRLGCFSFWIFTIHFLS